MDISQTLLPEFDIEMATTRKLLERVPEDRISWQPHSKSMSLGRLATHLAELPGMGHRVLTQESHNVAPPGGEGYKPRTLATRQEILDLFDKNIATTRQAIESAEDPVYSQPWSLLRGEQTMFTFPRVVVLRRMLFSHMIHHRGQLSVYLRLNDVPVPSIYGPSADEAV